MIRNVGLILLAVLLILLSVGWLGVQVPGPILGVFGLVTAVFILVGR